MPTSYRLERVVHFRGVETREVERFHQLVMRCGAFDDGRAHVDVGGKGLM